MSRVLHGLTETSTEAPLLLSVFPGFGIGGQQVRFATVANGLGACWRHAIIAMNGDISCRERLDPELEVSFPPLSLSKTNLAGLYLRLRAALHTLQPRVLLTHNWGAMEWAVANLLPRRLVAHVHAEDGFGPDERTRQLPRRIWTRRIALRRSTVMLPSQTLRSIASEQWRLSSGTLRYLPNGVDLGRFTSGRAPPPDSWELMPGGVVVGTVAALRPEKNLMRLVRAVALAGGHLRLVVVGDGPDRAKLQSLASQLLPPGNAVFLGHCADPSSTYRHMDIFALSSDTEQMPLTVLEAMASGLPIAATDVGDVATVVDRVNRPFVVPLDDAALAAALTRLASDPATRNRLGEANRLRVREGYDQEQMIRNWGHMLADAR